jgi:hypothetical protein
MGKIVMVIFDLSVGICHYWSKSITSAAGFPPYEMHSNSNILPSVVDK